MAVAKTMYTIMGIKHIARIPKKINKHTKAIDIALLTIGHLGQLDAMAPFGCTPAFQVLTFEGRDHQ